MNIEKVVVGMLETNCYLLEKNNQLLIIDPGEEYNKIKKAIGNRHITGIIITHYHIDHIGALEELKQNDNVSVYDYSNLQEGINSIGDFTFEMIKTPGHKEDLISIYFKDDNAMFVGDFIFRGTVGRTDLEGGNINDMQKSIEKIKKYPLNTVIYPGHGYKTTLGEEIKYNLYF